MLVPVLDEVGLLDVEVEEAGGADDVEVSEPRMGRSGSNPSPVEDVAEEEVAVAEVDMELADVAGAGGAGLVEVGRVGTEAPDVGCEAPPADWPACETWSGAS